MDNDVKQFWQDFCLKHNLATGTKVDAWAFGSNKKDADELAELVDKGIKTATTSEYIPGDEDMPKAGDWNIILDSQGDPVCVVQNKVVEIIPYNQISAEHAYHEGEGDRSYQYWRKVHDQFFEDEFKANGQKFYPQAPMVCEIFEKVE
ncbi:Uncharacterized protein JF75_18800 [Lactobacillus kimbladii]|uniref:ASCH domain-containing protein n=1 Tax=Lactobacillus kimbladii TaxID=1218506 RepID=A0A0F4LBC4_9LACO|nr:ASCH domain-containing protein [Lactobacillus kimbladii]KJY54871.1 Uncharacterized protein JF75_18800 [Lactobacillus kimbladii]